MSKVYFTKDTGKAAELFEASGIQKIISANDLVALKIHFGEPGNTAYLKPNRVISVFEKIKALGARPFFTDCNTLYPGPRSNSIEHRKVAADHGYTDVFIPEEDDFETVPVNLKHFKSVFIGNNARKSDAIIALTHFKGHSVTGFGGAIKNLGMGFGNRKGKLKMHQECKGCPKAPTCRKNITLEACWVGSPALVQEKIAEYAYGAVKDKKCAYINFITDVSPDCDCYDHNDPPIVPDIGILASFDPVAIDQACVDLVNQTEGRIKSRNKFRALYPNVDWAVQLKYAEGIGLGTRKYELIDSGA
ncbi:hypothetical protein A2276_03920 [candidate division WOR-1 bacterium RIFOXYA12_FULL_43_27]|uniref:DUF362 domain-containing protein n=1 Tax=candidate division WOR-1 bacterium RIFOXYC2_FULL_46_14 TaxID=1802587 RepID=A0A1F4U7E8_UNCSA|nr:MAG: hypothetical protein A2276_03920 [candidate division WOR-1 bacterium RIFOXYA12_FULL_43_27]OGC19159.1 MAG: hypothetical protein A2292_00415 [candidate division WOR-1 bacterium RIFOXYB2_FULL_46_45]OGC30148.1 MAG: hypothetical protein A2232_00415 [candidate division WOR-1 bacterium RIFOXYA2_FULL_46_56]OGC40750.1 MAG: hypothetical protein A2438_00420 [candidate division WOR-1 bacterium RIFOXYC2_FULL_46_14]